MTEPTELVVPPAAEQRRVEQQAAAGADGADNVKYPWAKHPWRRVDGGSGSRGRGSVAVLARVFNGAVGRNLGLVLALLVLCLVGVLTAGDRFASSDNLLTILRLASVIGVVSVGMTFVIAGGGIDLSVGAIVALASVWSTTLATQNMADDSTFLVMVFVALVVASGCGLVNGILVSYGRIVPFVATLAMLASARSLAEEISNRQTQVVRVDAFNDFFRAEPFGIPV
nr:ABC transporter permease [Micromonospora sp. DSM 115978]